MMKQTHQSHNEVTSTIGLRMLIVTVYVVGIKQELQP